MRLNLEELKYNNQVKGDFSDIGFEGDDKEITVLFEDNNTKGSINLSFDEIRQLWAKLLEYDKSKAKETSRHFSDNLLEANNIANKLSLDKYENQKLKLNDMKRFVQLYTELIEHAKFGLASQKSLDKQQQKIIHDESKLDEIKEKQDEFNKEAETTSKEFEKKVPRTSYEGAAVELDEILKKQEEEKKKMLEIEQKRLKELNEQAEKVQENPGFSKPNPISNTIDVHVDSDVKKVSPLFEENKGMKKFTQRNSDLDKIDFSKI